MLLGVDTGGTFTDFVALNGGQLRIHKVLSTPDAPEQAILQGINELGLMGQINKGEVIIVHGSTVATNTVLEGKGVPTVLVCNRGFKDLLSIGRQTRPQLYCLTPDQIAPPVPESHCLEVGGRLSAQGDVIEPLTEEDLQQLREQILALQPRAVAINLLFSFLDDSHEKAIEAIIPESIFSSRSSFVLPEYREYERGIATWLNAWLGPIVHRYVNELMVAVAPSPLTLMQSSGGTIAAAQAARRAVNLLLSGPAGGLAGALYIGKQINCERLLTFDMGGTSTDVALLDGQIELGNDGTIADYPVAIPMVNMHTIGAGGGSIAYLDEGGLLRVGPQSAGANPGPACYGLGGTSPTVTDANAVLGRLPADHFLGGRMTLDIDAARQALSPLAGGLSLGIEETALGIITLANEHMSRALRVISVQRGYDPAEFRLCCFGGAGGLHLCALAEELGMRQALVPVNAGVLSAFGMLVAPRKRHLSRSFPSLLQHSSVTDIIAIYEQLAREGIQQLGEEGVAEHQVKRCASMDLRYKGQSFTLNLLWTGSLTQVESAFHQQHEQRYGHALQQPVEIVNLRMELSANTHALSLPAAAVSASDPIELFLFGEHQPVAMLPRKALQINRPYSGPLLIVEDTTTAFIARDWQVRKDTAGNLLIDRS